MEALRITATINQAVITAIPALRPLLGHEVEMIALDLGPQASAQPETKKISFDEFLATRLPWPADRPSVSLEDMERAIIEGALNSADL
jgi:hypothetical protein